MSALFDSHAKNLAGRAAKASLYSLSTRAIRIVAQTVNFIILARFLGPEDFGLVGMVTPIIAIAMVVGDLGLSAATIQARVINARQASSLFYIGLLSGLTTTLLVMVLSPAVAEFYNEPRATAIAYALSWVFFLTSLSSQHQALLQRSLNFRSIFIAELFASSGSFIVSCFLVLNDFGYWAIVTRLILHPLLYAVVIWTLARWIPSAPEWSSSTISMIRYGGYTFGFNILNTTGRQLDNVLIGWRWGELALGPYALAYRIFFVPVQQLTQPLGQVMVPVLAKLREEPERYRRWYTDVLKVISYFSMPPMIAVSICATDFVVFVGGPRWVAAGNILRWLALIGAAHIAYTSIGWLMLSNGRADRYFGWALIAVPIYIVSFFAGLPWGAEGVAIGYFLANLLLMVPGVLWACRNNPVSIRAVFTSLMPAIVACIATATTALAITTWLSDSSPIWRLAIVAFSVGTGVLGCTPLVFGRLAVRLTAMRVRAAIFKPISDSR